MKNSVIYFLKYVVMKGDFYETRKNIKYKEIAEYCKKRRMR